MEWISINDKLPEWITIPKPQQNGNTLYFYGMYLVYGYYNNEDKSDGYHVSAYKPGSVYWYFTSPSNFTVTHWAELPKPPKQTTKTQ